MNLRTQLEGNSFAEMIERNTDGTSSLKADAFATADCKFELENLLGTPDGVQHAGSARRSPTTRRPTVTSTRCSCASPTARSSTGPQQHRPAGHQRPVRVQRHRRRRPCLRRQRQRHVLGRRGNDIIEGNGGDDVALGGDGDDIITDLDGAESSRAGPATTPSTVARHDILLGGDGQDFPNGGANDNETFAGPGTTSSSPARARTPCSAMAGTTGSRAARPGPAPGRPRRAVLRRPGRAEPGNDSSSVRSARTTTTPRAATT